VVILAAKAPADPSQWQDRGCGHAFREPQRVLGEMTYPDTRCAYDVAVACSLPRGETSNESRNPREKREKNATPREKLSALAVNSIQA
jgi:hypothetical protein